MEDNNVPKPAASSKLYYVALGWVMQEGCDLPVDLDLSCFLLNEERKVRSNDDVIFYNQLDTPNGYVQHMGDCLGDSLGESTPGDEEEHEDDVIELDSDSSTPIADAETIAIDLALIPDDVIEAVFTVTIYEHQKRNHNFGMVENAYVRLYNKSGKELLRYELKDSPQETTGLIFCSFERKEGKWNCRPRKRSFQGGMQELTELYGVEIE